MHFKLLSGGNPYIHKTLPEELAGWYYVNLSEIRGPFVLKEGRFNGILEFLSRFTPNYIVGIEKITGPDGYEHTYYNFGMRGWGFNIQTDPMTISWIEPVFD